MINIAIGTEPRTEIAKKVLEYSIIKNTSSKINFKYLMGEDYTDRGPNNQGTGFSLLRFKTPEIFEFKDYAIYLDADMLVLKDINELYDYRLKNNAVVWCKFNVEEAETSVMLFDCKKSKSSIWSQEKIKKYLNSDDLKKYRYVMKLKYLKEIKPISKYWNIMDRTVSSNIDDFASPEARLLHYTDVPKQPWYYPEHKYAYIWEDYFKLAYIDGYLNKDEIMLAGENFNTSNPRRPNGLHKYWVEKIC